MEEIQTCWHQLRRNCISRSLRSAKRNNGTPEIELEEGKTLRDYITYYADSAQNSQVEKITEKLGVDSNLLREMMRLDLTENSLNEFGRFDRLKASVNKSLAKAFFDKPDSPVSQFTANLLATKLLRNFILEGGFDLDTWEQHSSH